MKGWYPILADRRNEPPVRASCSSRSHQLTYIKTASEQRS